MQTLPRHHITQARAHSTSSEELRKQALGSPPKTTAFAPVTTKYINKTHYRGRYIQQPALCTSSLIILTVVVVLIITSCLAYLASISFLPQSWRCIAKLSPHPRLHFVVMALQYAMLHANRRESSPCRLMSFADRLWEVRPGSGCRAALLTSRPTSTSAGPR